MISPILELLRDFLCLSRSPVLFVGEDHAHRHEIQGDEHRRIDADPSDGRKSMICDKSDAGDTDQQQSEADGQRVTLVGPGADGLRLNGIHQRQDDEVEHAAAQYIS